MKSSRVISFMVTLLLLVSCNSGSDNLEKMIPADAMGVVSVNFPNLLKKTGIKSDGKLEIPDAIKDVVDANDASIINTVMTDLPFMGLDTSCKVFVYFTNKTFASVLLAALDDEDAALGTISRRTGGDFASIDGMSCLYHEDRIYVIKDKVLLIGTVNKAMEIDKLARQARAVLSKQRQSILDNEQVKNIINNDSDINAYILQDGLRLILRKCKAYREIAQKLPLIEIFTESDIKAYEGHLQFEDDSAQLTTCVIADENSDYNNLLQRTLSGADAGFLKAMPNSMDFIVSMSVKGDNFVKLQQIQQLVGMFKRLPFIGRIDIEGILSSIDGPIAVGLARDPHLEGEWNAVIAAKTSKPEMILRQISSFASSMGQAPEIYDNEYIYQYENKMIKLGVVDGVLYLKMLDYEQTEGNAYELEPVRNVFGTSSIGCYVNPQISEGGTFMYGMSDGQNGVGQFVPADHTMHSALAFLKVLCSIKPAQAYDDMIDDDDYTSTLGSAIDQLKPVE